MPDALPSWPDLRARFAGAKVGFAFVIPVYNHARNLERVVQSALASGVPVIVVDDGSTDETGEVTGRLAPAVVVRHPTNQGKGAAILTGLRTASEPPIGAHFAVVIDGDGQHNPDDARALLAALWEQGAEAPRSDIVIGVRLGMNQTHVPWTSRAGRRFSGFWIWASGGPALSDSQSGFRVYPIAETLALPTKARRYEFEVEVLVHARRAGIVIREAPVSVAYDPPGGRISHFRPWRDSWRNSVAFTRLLIARLIPGFARRKRLGTDAGDGA
jgi:glycosyltransferase involved in cell wall biosynthesis